MGNNFSVGVKFKGYDALMKTLRELPEAVEKRVANDACAAGARVIGQEWERRAPAKALKKTAVLKGNAAARHIGSLKANASGIAIVAFQQPGSRLAHLFEFGTSERTQTTTGRRTGRMPARPFMRPALDAVENDVLAAMAEKARTGLARETRKLAGSGL